MKKVTGVKGQKLQMWPQKKPN